MEVGAGEEVSRLGGCAGAAGGAGAGAREADSGAMAAAWDATGCAGDGAASWEGSGALESGAGSDPARALVDRMMAGGCMGLEAAAAEGLALG